MSLVAPTGAVLGDEIWEEEEIVLSPHNGPNGKYASYDSNGNLSIDLGNDLNADAVTTYEGVFDVSNGGSNYVRVWITHNATDYVEFRTGSHSIQNEENGTVLSPGETVVVGMSVDTHNASPGAQVIQQMDVHARKIAPPTPAGSSGSSGGSSGGATIPTGTSRDPSGTLVTSGRVRIEFDRELRPDEHVRVARIGGLPPDPAARDVTAVATSREDGSGAINTSAASADRIRELAVDEAVTPGDTFVVTGTNSLFPSVASIDPRRRTAAVYDITPPPRLEDSAATIWVTVNRSRLGDADLSGIRLGRRTEAGWQLLETRTTLVNDTRVGVRSRTPGFSTFALFPEPDVTYRWRFEDRETIEAEDVAVTYEEAGIYEGTLSVTDAHGRSDSTTYRVLVNDRPSVRVETPPTIEPGERVTLRANVTDAYGNESVTWKFDDGTVAEGATVTRTFAGGERVATVTVEDEFGATGSTRARFHVGGHDPVVQVVEFALGVEGRLALVAVLSLAIVGSLRWLVDRSGVGEGRRSR